VHGQSAGQVEQDSPADVSHVPLPQIGQVPQSPGQLLHVSP
jgi:hypothetical protein